MLLLFTENGLKTACRPTIVRGQFSLQEITVAKLVLQFGKDGFIKTKIRTRQRIRMQHSKSHPLIAENLLVYRIERLLSESAKEIYLIYNTNLQKISLYTTIIQTTPKL